MWTAWRSQSVRECWSHFQSDCGTKWLSFWCLSCTRTMISLRILSISSYSDMAHWAVSATWVRKVRCVRTVRTHVVDSGLVQDWLQESAMSPWRDGHQNSDHLNDGMKRTKLVHAECTNCMPLPPRTVKFFLSRYKFSANNASRFTVCGSALKCWAFPIVVHHFGKQCLFIYCTWRGSFVRNADFGSRVCRGAALRWLLSGNWMRFGTYCREDLSVWFACVAGHTCAELWRGHCEFTVFVVKIVLSVRRDFW